jgi:ribosomal protein S18 acetylase RimI-like enzyme
MLIRLAVRENVAAVMALLRQVVPLMQAAGNLQWDERYPDEAVFELDVVRKQLWVAEVDGVIAGMAAVTTEPELEYAQVGWDIEEPAVMVHRLAVDPAFRGAGIAALMMRKAEEVATERGISVVRTDTSAENATAQRLFSKLGYELAGEIGLSFRPGLRVLCYEKRLNQAQFRSM